MLVRRLMEIQRTFGYLPKHDLNLLSEELGVPKSQVWDVAGYFPSFLHEPGPDLTIGVCREWGTATRASPEIRVVHRVGSRRRSCTRSRTINGSAP